LIGRIFRGFFVLTRGFAALEILLQGRRQALVAIRVFVPGGHPQSSSAAHSIRL